jgi:hypothetical protein
LGTAARSMRRNGPGSTNLSSTSNGCTRVKTQRSSCVGKCNPQLSYDPFCLSYSRSNEWHERWKCCVQQTGAHGIGCGSTTYSHKRFLERSFEAPAQRKRVAMDPSTSFAVHVLPKDIRDLHVLDLHCILSCAACIPPSAAHSDCHYHGPRLQGESAWCELCMLQTLGKSGSNRGTV